jgi:hopanoid-associated phosphorylase
VRRTPIIVVVGLQFEARIAAGPDIQVICSGDGRDLAAMLERAVAAGARGLLSFGLAGGLAPDLRPGACVVASEIILPSERMRTDPEWSRNLLAALPHAISGAVLGAPTPVAAVETKQALRRATGAHAVDMESHVVAQAAAARGLPLAAVRIIVDPAERAVPPAALSGMRPDGSTDAAAVLASLLRRPQDIAALFRTALDARIARAALLRGRRLLGPRFAFPDLGKFQFDMA